MTEPLRAANEIAGQALYDCQLVGLGDSVTAINGMVVAARPISSLKEKQDAVVVCASYNRETYDTPQLIHWLRHQNVLGSPLGCADAGAFILARAGLLEGEPVTLHWKSADSFREQYPHLNTSSNLFEFSTRRFSCAGATTGMDLVLHIIEQHHGAHFSARVANHFIRGTTRIEQQYSSAELAHTKGVHLKVRLVIKIMEQHCEQPLSIAQCALKAGLSVRQLEVLFKRDTGITPIRYYQLGRLHKARNILQQSSLPVMEVGLACGFASRTQFSRAYKKVFGHSPVAERKR